MQGGPKNKAVGQAIVSCGLPNCERWHRLYQSVMGRRFRLPIFFTPQVSRYPSAGTDLRLRFAYDRLPADVTFLPVWSPAHAIPSSLAESPAVKFPSPRKRLK